MTLCFITSLFCFSAAAQEQRFLPYSALDKKIQERLGSLKDSVHRLESCTSTVISSEGHILTNRHCLQPCLIGKGVLKEIRGPVSYFVLQPELLGKVVCQVALDGEKVDVRVEATAPGLVMSQDEPGLRTLEPALYDRLMEEGYGLNGDFAIVKVVGEKRDWACTPLADRSPLPGETIHTLGFPSKTERPDGFNSDGTQMYYSSGSLISGIAENSCVQDAHKTAAELDKLRRIYESPYTFLSTLDVVERSSGSAVVNEKGEIAGLLNSMYQVAFPKPGESAKERYCRGSAKSIRVERLRELMGPLALECKRP